MAAYKTQRWYGSNVQTLTQHGYLNIEHDQKDNTLVFYSNGSGKSFTNINELLNVLKSRTHRIFLEWCQQSTGSYIYYDLYKVIEKLKQYKSIDVNILTIDVNKQNVLDQSCYFDESVSIESQLKKTDTLILSPVRSMLATYTPMGNYEGHQLYLGPIPTEQFLKQFKIIYIFNCCQKKNIGKLIKNTVAIERVFNVANWKWNNKYIYKPLININKLQLNECKSNEENKVNNSNKGIQMNKMEYLDAMIDEIHQCLKKGNIVIHCLAGAHRSPFITGCYLYKYGLKDYKQTPKDIYKHLKGKRLIVQKLGYDKQLKLYQNYLKETFPRFKKC